MNLSCSNNFSTSSTIFATKLFKEVINNRTGNILISPIAIQIALSMLLQVSSGNTKKEIESLLTYCEDYLECILETWKTINSTNQMHLVNKVLVSDLYPFQNSSHEAAQSFGIDISGINLSDHFTAHWISDSIQSKTNKTIKNFIYEEDLHAHLKVLIASVFSFYGIWKVKFDDQKTINGSMFHFGYNIYEYVSMMETVEYFNYKEYIELDFAVLEIPYSATNFSLLILLPNSKTGLSALEEKINELILIDIFQDFTDPAIFQKVKVKLPKFVYDCGLDLENPLRNVSFI